MVLEPKIAKTLVLHSTIMAEIVVSWLAETRYLELIKHKLDSTYDGFQQGFKFTVGDWNEKKLQSYFFSCRRFLGYFYTEILLIGYHLISTKLRCARPKCMSVQNYIVDPYWCTMQVDGA